jgi:carbonic anhydrase
MNLPLKKEPPRFYSMTNNPLPTQEELRGNADPLLAVLAERIVEFRDQHLHEGSDYLDAIVNGQKPLAFVSQCIDSRQPVHTITGLPPGKLVAQSSIAGFLHALPESASAWASILFSVKNLGAPVIIKLGHTGCGGSARLVDLCLDKTLAEQDPDPCVEWLADALPLTRQVIARMSGQPREVIIHELEAELVRDGVKKLNHFFDDMIQHKYLLSEQRPVVVGLLFEMHTAELHYLLPNGEFKLLSELYA